MVCCCDDLDCEAGNRRFAIKLIPEDITMEVDLLRKEQEFHKINSELEERTNRILLEIDAAKNRTGPQNDTKLNQVSRQNVNHCKSFSMRNEDSLANLASKEEKAMCASNKKEIVEDSLGMRSNGLGYEATNRLLRAKLTILNKEIDVLRQDYKAKSEECRKINIGLNRTEEECSRLESTLSAARETAANLQSKLEATLQTLTRTQAENLSLNKDITVMKKDLKQQKQQTSAIELRLNRALEENEKLRNSAKETQLQNKEDRENQRKTIDQLQSKLKALERQRTELTSVCSKQLHLIDNLRRQKAHLEVNRCMQTVEAEFDNVLDWCLKNENQ